MQQTWAVTAPVDPAALRRQRDACLEECLRQREGGADDTLLAPLRAKIDRYDALLAGSIAARQGMRPHGSGGDGTVAGLGSVVTVRWDDGDEATYTIVGSLAVEPSAHRISYESPVGRALLGRRAAEWVEVVTPARQQRLLLVSVRHRPLEAVSGARPAAGR